MLRTAALLLLPLLAATQHLPAPPAKAKQLLVGKWVDVRDDTCVLTITATQAVYRFGQEPAEVNSYTVSTTSCEPTPGSPPGTFYLNIMPIKKNPHAMGETGCHVFEVTKEYLSMTSVPIQGRASAVEFRRVK